MANEIEFVHSVTGSANVKVILGNAAGQRWNTSGTPALETLTIANLGSYDIALTEDPAGSYRYRANMPAGINTRMDVLVWVYEKSGDLVAADLPNYLGHGVIPWSGSAIVEAAAENMASTSQSAFTNLSFAANWLEGAGIAASAFTSAKFSTDAKESIADTLLDRAAGVETGLTLRQWFRLSAAALFGKTTNGQKTFRDFADTKNRIVSTLEADGDRSVVTRDAT